MEKTYYILFNNLFIFSFNFFNLSFLFYSQVLHSHKRFKNNHINSQKIRFTNKL